MGKLDRVNKKTAKKEAKVARKNKQNGGSGVGVIFRMLGVVAVVLAIVLGWTSLRSQTTTSNDKSQRNSEDSLSERVLAASTLMEVLVTAGATLHVSMEAKVCLFFVCLSLYCCV